MRFASLILLAACGARAPAIEPAALADPGHAAALEPVHAAALEPAHAAAHAAALEPALGMNDVSILLPLPRDPHAPVLAAIAGLVERGWFDALVTDRHDIAPRVAAPIAFADYQVVAVRFDLCDRSTVGVCPREVDGRLRLVLQPMYLRAGATAAHDVALHAFYPVPAAELAQVIGELRALAQRQQVAPDAPLAVSRAAAAGDAVYLARLRALVLRYARGADLARLTVIGQIADSAAFAWIFRGLERRGDAVVTLEIPGIPGTAQRLQLAGGDTVYQTDPVADAPAGFALAINGPRFAAATPVQRAGALAALTAIQNPLVHDAIDTQCIACHVATYLTARRATAIGLAPAAIAGRFASRHELAVHTIAGADPRVVRGFGWAASVPAISQRVVNDTAQVLAEIEARFPAPQL